MIINDRLYFYQEILNQDHYEMVLLDSNDDVYVMQQEKNDILIVLLGTYLYFVYDCFFIKMKPMIFSINIQKF